MHCSTSPFLSPSTTRTVQPAAQGKRAGMVPRGATGAARAAEPSQRQADRRASKQRESQGARGGKESGRRERRRRKAQEKARRAKRPPSTTTTSQATTERSNGQAPRRQPTRNRAGLGKVTHQVGHGWHPFCHRGRQKVGPSLGKQGLGNRPLRAHREEAPPTPGPSLLGSGAKHGGSFARFEAGQIPHEGGGLRAPTPEDFAAQHDEARIP